MTIIVYPQQTTTASGSVTTTVSGSVTNATITGQGTTGSNPLFTVPNNENPISLPPYLQVARGLVSGASVVSLQGYNASIGTSFVPVWDANVAYVYPTSALTMTYASTATETLTMTVTGLDINYAIISDTVTFTASTTGTSGGVQFFRINNMTITSGTNAGNVTAKNGANTYAQINAGNGRTNWTLYTVPAGYTLYLTRAQAFTTNNGNNYATYNVYSQTITGGVTTSNNVLTAPFTPNYSSLRVAPRPYLQKTDIQWQLKQTAAAPGSIQLEGFLIATGTA